MPHLEDALKQDLLETDLAFRRLWEEHRSCEQRLAELSQKSLLSEEDELEEKQIKRRKLFLKDRMEAILREHREARATAPARSGALAMTLARRESNAVLVR